jgi:hypothetical protein
MYSGADHMSLNKKDGTTLRPVCGEALGIARKNACSVSSLYDFHPVASGVETRC